MAVQAEIGIFGGSGFYQFLPDVEEVRVHTPYGPPSDKIAIATLAGKRVAFLPPSSYADFAAPIFAAFAQPALTTRESDVAEAVWAAVHDISGQLRFPAGADAVALANAG